MNDGIHLLLAVGLVAWLEKPSDPAPYLVAIAAVGVTMVDRFTFTPLVNWGYLDGSIWIHRSVTHSLLVGALVVGAAAALGLWRAGILGYAAAVLPDVVFGGVKPFLPFDATTVGLYVDTWPEHALAMTGVVALLSAVAILAELYRLTGGPDRRVVDWINHQREGLAARRPRVRDRSD